MKKPGYMLGSISLAFFLFLGVAHAETLVNGSFESGDYSGWVVLEGGTEPTWGTWGIVADGQTVAAGDELYDYFDGINVVQKSPGLPRTFAATDGSSMACQLPNGPQDHRLFQEVALPETALALSWDMFYENFKGSFASNQALAVSIRDLNDNILETLFYTDENQSQVLPMTNFVYDISQYAGMTVRVDVLLRANQHYFDLGLDNFAVLVSDESGSESPEALYAPPGWSKATGKAVGWSKKESLAQPKGFSKGLKKGWDK